MIDLISKTHLSLKKQRDLAIVATGLMVAANFVLGIALFHKDEKVILVPPVLREKAWLSNQSVSEEYLREQNLFFLHLFLDIQPKLMDWHAATILDHTAPESINAVRKSLLEKREKYSEVNLSMSFAPKTMKVDQQNMVVITQGSLIIYHDNMAQEIAEKTYVMKFNYNHGAILLKEFGELKDGDLQEKSLFQSLGQSLKS